MKKLTLLIAHLLFMSTLIAQLPNQFKYQAVLRNAEGEVIANQNVTIDISILQGSALGTSVFRETHYVATTAQGLINLNIGSVEDMSIVDWGSGTYFVEMSVNGTIMGASQLLSVPYAIHAQTAETVPALENCQFYIVGTMLKVQIGEQLLEVDLKPVLEDEIDNIEQIGDISIENNQLLLGSTGKTIDLSTYLDNTDEQKLTLEKNQLSISNGNSVDLSGYVSTVDYSDEFEGKVDKEVGKGLSSNDYTTAEKNNLANQSGINTGDQDLSHLAEKTELETKVDKVDGKGLSSNDYTTAEKNNLANQSGVNTGDQDLSHLAIKTDVDANLDTKVDKETGKGLSTNDFTDAEKTKLANQSGTNTGDQDLSHLAEKTDVVASLETKVDKETGKGLSTNDFTTVEKSKLEGVEENAEVNVNADWNAASGDAQIVNKPVNIDVDKTDDVLLTGNQTINGLKVFNNMLIAQAGIGTTGKTFELNVASERVMKVYHQNSNLYNGFSPNITLGCNKNEVNENTMGSVILGGGSYSRYFNEYGGAVTIDESNYIYSSFSAIVGGKINKAGGYCSIVAGGYNNSAIGDYSFAGGYNADATHNGAFVWADNSDLNTFKSERANQFCVRARGGVLIQTGAGAGTWLLPGSTSWSIFSDKRKKTNFKKVNTGEVLQKLVNIPVLRWNYKWQTPDLQHMGVMAQDFHAAFGLYGSKNDTTLTSADLAGVSMAAIQGLYNLVVELQESNKQIKQVNTSLKQSIAILKQENTELKQADTELKQTDALLWEKINSIIKENEELKEEVKKLQTIYSAEK